MQKIYCGSGKSVKFNDGGELIACSICIDDAQEYFQTAKNGKKYLNVKVCAKRQVDQWGKTHYVEVDTWKPQTRVQSATINPVTGGQVPF